MDMLSGESMTERGARREAGDASISVSSMIEELIGFVRRQLRVLVIGPATALLLGLAYMLVTPSQYTATTTLLVDSSPLRVLQSQSQAPGNIPPDALQVASQVDIIESDNVALAVIRKLGLTQDPEFGGTSRGLFSGAADPGSNEDKERLALETLASHRRVSRIERTYVLDVSFTSRNPVTAAKVANAIAEAYIDDQLEAKDQTRRRAGAWLQERISDLRAEVRAADRAVLEFKEKNNIIDLGTSSAGSSASPGRLIGEQQLYDLSSQLSTARGATGEAKARLDRIEQVRKMDIKDAAVADILRDEVITRLRNQYLDLSAREALLSTRYGADHSAPDNIRNQMAELTKNIGSELGRIAGSYRSDYEIAKSREENLEREMAGLVSVGRVTNRDRLGLAELESSAKIYHEVYDNYFQRYMDAIQQQTFPITDARVISFAAPPSRKSRPNNVLVLAIALTMGTIVSLGLGGVREATDSVFRTGRQLEQALQHKCLAVIPQLRLPVGATPGDKRRQARVGPAVVERPTETVASTFSEPVLRYAADAPLSVFAEAVRAIKVTVSVQAMIRENKVIGITSTLPNEGKSTVACNLAVLMADAGKRVILLDADLRNPTLARSLEPKPAHGLLELLSGSISLAQATRFDPTTNLTLLPFVSRETLPHSDEVLCSPAFKVLIDQLRQHYDHVIVDLPPLAPVVDVRAALPVIDSLVFVVEWGRTRISTVQRHLTAAPEVSDRLLGTVLNKADLKTMERFEQRGLYHDGYYANQGYQRPS